MVPRRNRFHFFVTQSQTASQPVDVGDPKSMNVIDANLQRCFFEQLPFAQTGSISNGCQGPGQDIFLLPPLYRRKRPPIQLPTTMPDAEG